MVAAPKGPASFFENPLQVRVHPCWRNTGLFDLINAPNMQWNDLVGRVSRDMYMVPPNKYSYSGDVSVDLEYRLPGGKVRKVRLGVFRRGVGGARV
jgi:hypothetical protein